MPHVSIGGKWQRRIIQTLEDAPDNTLPIKKLIIRCGHVKGVGYTSTGYNSFFNTLHIMCNRGSIERIERGVYRLV